jgi:hypothetical protein
MGFFIRKSVRLGPVLFNLATSGIGTSIGVRGLRVGQNALGRGYIFGRVFPGLYYRQALGTSKSGGAGCALVALAALFLILLAAALR